MGFAVNSVIFTCFKLHLITICVFQCILIFFPIVDVIGRVASSDSLEINEKDGKEKKKLQLELHDIE